MRLNPLASVLEKRLFKRAKSKKTLKRERPGGWNLWSTYPLEIAEISVLYLKRQLMIYQMRVFSVEPYDPPSFCGALFLLVCLLFFLKPQKTTIIFGQCFLFVSVLLFLWNILPKECPKHWKQVFSCLCLAGSFSLSSKSSAIHKAKKQTKKKWTTQENKQRLSLQKSQSVGLLTLQTWVVSPKVLNCSPLAYRVTEHFLGGWGVLIDPSPLPPFGGGVRGLNWPLPPLLGGG